MINAILEYVEYAGIASYSNGTFAWATSDSDDSDSYEDPTKYTDPLKAAYELMNHLKLNPKQENDTVVANVYGNEVKAITRGNGVTFQGLVNGEVIVNHTNLAKVLEVLESKRLNLSYMEFLKMANNNKKQKLIESVDTFLEQLDLGEELATPIKKAIQILMEDAAPAIPAAPASTGPTTSFSNTAAAGMQPPKGGYFPSIYSASKKTQENQKEVNNRITKINKARLCKLFENLGVKPSLKVALTEGFDIILEEYSWNTTDPTASAGFGSAGSNRPMFDLYDPFKLATGGGTDDLPAGNPSDTGFGQIPQKDTPVPTDKYNFPEAKLNSDNDVKTLIKTAQSKIPLPGKQGGFSPTPTWKASGQTLGNEYF